jgi:hypothetical protein
MTNQTKPALQNRVDAAAQTALTHQDFVSVIDVFNLIGWLPTSAVDMWRQGRIDCLESEMQVGPDKIATVLRLVQQWANEQGLVPLTIAYLARTGDQHELQFSRSNDPALERAYRTHWISPELSPKQTERLAERQSRAPELVVIWSTRDWNCSTCGDEKGSGQFLTMEDAGPVCMRCASLDKLLFLASGDAKLTRRARSLSSVAPVVVRFSRARRRYERQGILVEAEALEQAEQECLLPDEVEQRRQIRAWGDEDAEDKGPRLRVLEGGK